MRGIHTIDKELRDGKINIGCSLKLTLLPLGIIAKETVLDIGGRVIVGKRLFD